MVDENEIRDDSDGRRERDDDDDQEWWRTRWSRTIEMAIWSRMRWRCPRFSERRKGKNFDIFQLFLSLVLYNEADRFYHFLGQFSGLSPDPNCKTISQLNGRYFHLGYRPIYQTCGDVSTHINPKQYPVKFCTYRIVLDKIPLSRLIYKYIDQE